MAKAAILSYIKRKSPVHELTGTTKLIYFITWSVASMVTYDTRIPVSYTHLTLPTTSRV